MWQLDYKEAWALKNWYLETGLENTLESSLDCKEIKPVNPKGNQLWNLLEGLLMLKLQYFGHLMLRANSLEETLMLEKTEGKRRRGQQRMKWLDSEPIQHQFTNLNKPQEIMKDREAWRAWGRKESDMT